MSSTLHPPSRIFLFRHAKAGWAEPGGRDFDRALTDEGFVQAELVTDVAADRGYRPGLVVSSTALRCRQTADAVRRAFDAELEFRYVDELYNCPADVYLEILAEIGDPRPLMFVGHNPAMEELLTHLTGIDSATSHIPSGFPTAGLAVLDRADASAPSPFVIADFLTA